MGNERTCSSPELRSDTLAARQSSFNRKPKACAFFRTRYFAETLLLETLLLRNAASRNAASRNAASRNACAFGFGLNELRDMMT